MDNAPIDYEKTIADTVDKICDYYDKYVEKRAGKLSVQDYNKYKNVIVKLRSDAKKDDFYKRYGWFQNDFCDLANFAGGTRQVFERFFGDVSDYKERKTQKLLTTTEERNLINAVKSVNIKIGGEFFAPLKELFVPASYYVSRGSK